jgi:hypothetical protein
MIKDLTKRTVTYSVGEHPGISVVRWRDSDGGRGITISVPNAEGETLNLHFDGSDYMDLAATLNDLLDQAINNPCAINKQD